MRLLKLSEAQVRWRRSGAGSAAAEPAVDIPDMIPMSALTSDDGP
ncbi:hypothetical protein SAMN06273567_10911 [Geodermatophilus aquaeductus]|uniref:Uncharacterized protein n=1 Tax=Geodermatophilus aquaeductus TaxID=1564161 RepID=A0A521FHV6_9ACTN|nr:hypothetical protein SAMN06273567_10911 [Geodermatophilus aquaeductus]